MKSLLNSEKADLDNDGKLSSYERKRGEAIEKSMREKKSIGGAIARAISKSAPKATDNIVKGAVKEFPSTRKVEPKEANELYQFLKGKVKLDETDPRSEIEEAALKELKAIADGDTPRSLQLFEVFLDGDIKSLDAFMDAYIKVPTTEGPSLLTDIPPKSRTINNEGGYIDDMERLGLAEGTNDENNAKVQNYRVILAGLRKVSEEDRAKAKMLVKEGKALPEEFMIKEEAGVVMNPMDAYKNHPDLFMKALNFLEEPRIEKAEGGEMLNDEDMEENFVEYIIKESLSEEEQNELKEQLEANPKLSELFDEVVIKASEFTGAGSVDGPGTGTSDDIPARLSDGEFVFTAKAVEHIGADNLMKMMKDAEAAHDAGGKREAMQEGGMSSDTEKVEVEYTINRPADTVVSGATPLLAQREQEDMMDEEIKKGMLGVTPYVRS